MLVQGILATGKYSVTATYRVPHSIEGVWHGEITTPRLTLRVIRAGGLTAKPAELLRQGRREALRRETAEKAIPKLRALSDPSQGGPFSKYAGYWEAFAHSTLGRRGAFQDTLSAYVARYAAVPFYSYTALSQLALSLSVDGKYEEAKKVYERLPDGYERRQGIRFCDDQLTKQRQPEMSIGGETQ